MIDTINRTMHTAEMSDLVFYRLGEFIEKELGIRMPPSKKTMLAARLQKRLRFLHLNSFEEYYDYVFSPDGIENELIHMIDIVTTNKTDFYREPAHFDYLFSTALPELINLRGSGVRKKLLIWSAGCSTGEEPYTLAILIREVIKDLDNWNIEIYATDASTDALQRAKEGLYKENSVKHMSKEYRTKYFKEIKNPEQNHHYAMQYALH
ncbi:MAG: chemotaxis protein CheR, partial [Thermodesulfovibrionia bacterium]|nr:chemotaxis protein CheR [Thermodesulfovibrionia bacterium]